MKYKNITKQELAIPNVGVVKAGEIIETDIEINNSNLQEVVNKKETKSEQNKEEDK